MSKIPAEIWVGSRRYILPKSIQLNKENIINCLARYYNINKAELLTRNGIRQYTEPRQMAHLFAMMIPGWTLKITGAEIGGLDHSTVSHSLKTAVGLYDTNPKYRSMVDNIGKQFGISEEHFNRHLNRWRK